MDFTSLPFLFIFFPVFLSIFLIARPSLRLLLISVANIAFLLAGQALALLPLIGIALAGYVIGILIDLNRGRRGIVAILLWSGIGLNIGILAMFKLVGAYGTKLPFADTLQTLGIVSLLGLSYITFQIISYIVDVSRGTIPAERNPVRFAAYVLFFPKLVSGPLTRYKQFRDQVSSLEPSVEDIAGGVRRVLIGVLKRVLIANQLGVVANAVFDLSTPNIEPLFAWLALIAYTLQIYFDFSGYTDIAIGLGKMMGITLPENFNYPYMAQGISDFWRRWHITLSSWFREYVFYPLERRKLKIAGQQINLIVVFLLTGLWHGPTLTYLVWGLLHGLAIAFESAGGGRWLKTLWQPLRHVYAMSLIMLGWVFFRSHDLSYAFEFLSRLFGNRSGITPLPFSQSSPLPLIEPSFVILTLIALLFSFPLGFIWKNIRSRMEKANETYFFVFQTVEDVAVVMFFVLAIAAQLSGTFQPNIYAKF